MLEIYVTRHGETEWNQIRRMQGQQDSPLTVLGIEQAKWLSQRLAGKTFSYVYTSPLGRAKETAKIINETLGANMVEDERLKEIYLGDWEGKLLEDIERDYAKENREFWNDPVDFHMEDKETFKEVRDRAADFFEALIRQHGEGKILIVAHAIILKGMLNYIKGEGINQFWRGRNILPTSLTKINVVDNRYTIIYEGEVSHHRKEMEKGWFIEK